MAKNSVATTRLSSSQLEHLFIENNSDAVITLDPDGIIAGWNSGAEKLYGHARLQALNQPVSILFPPQLPYEQAIQSRYLNSPRPVNSWETKQVRKDGSEISLSISVTPFFDKSGKLTARCMVARHRQRTNDFQTKVRQLQKLETVGKLAGGIAHDFNNLLTVIAGYNSLLRSSLPDEGPLAGYAVEVEKAAERAASLTSQLLVFSKRAVIAPEIVNVNVVAQDLEKMLERIEGENIRIVFELRCGLRNIKADPTQISQMLMNLAINARYAMPHGGVLRIATSNVHLDKPAAEAAGWEPGHYVQIDVADTGLGMDESTRQHLFDPVFINRTTGNGPGLSGPGLSIVYGIVSRAGGYIRVASEPGKGSCFTLSFPAAIGADEEADAIAISNPAPRHQPTGNKILLVEDENGVRMLVKEMLLNLGYRVHDAASAEQAMEMARGRHYDLLLTDVIMTSLGGKELADHLQIAQPDLKVLYMSGYVDDSLIPENFLRVGVNFLLKPFSADQLASQVKLALQLSPVLAV